jgi:hypothetical protein
MMPQGAASCWWKPERDADPAPALASSLMFNMYFLSDANRNSLSLFPFIYFTLKNIYSRKEV